MRIYYRGPEAVVTSEFFIRRGSPPEVFAVRDLRNVCIAPDVADGPGAVLIPAAAALAAATAVYGVAGWGYAVGLLAVAAGAIAGTASGRRRPHPSELRADYRGSTVVLYASADTRVFNQVRRGLQRAIEDLPPSASPESVEAA